MFYDLLYALKALPDADAGAVIKALVDYEIYDIDKGFIEGRLDSIYEMGRHQLDRGREIFEERFGK